jgi:hypothetical protein
MGTYAYSRDCHMGVAERLAHRHGAAAFSVHDSDGRRPVFAAKRVHVYVTLLNAELEVCGRFLVGHMQGADEPCTTGFVVYPRAIPQDWFSDDGCYGAVISMSE